MVLATLLIEMGMTNYILLEPVAITEIFDKYKLSQNRHEIFVIILISRVIYNRNLLCTELCRDVAMSKQ